MSQSRFDNPFLWGSDASHSFLALCDEKGRVVSEIHGKPTDQKTSSSSTHGLRLSNLFKIAAQALGLSRTGNTLAKAGGLLNPNILKISMHPQDKNAEAQKTLLEGTEEDMRTKWLEMADLAKKINDHGIVYSPLAFSQGGDNCHAVTNTLCRHILGIELKAKDMAFATPGLSTDLLKRYPAIQKPEPRSPMDLAELRHLCQQAQQEIPSNNGAPSPHRITKPQMAHA